MNFLKRLSVYCVFVLLLMSLYKDIIRESSNKDQLANQEDIFEPTLSTSFQVLKIKVEPGDTLLSVSEQINHIDILDVEQLIQDFKMINPFVDPFALKPNVNYYFPLYNSNKN